MTTAHDLLFDALHTHLPSDAETGERWSCGDQCPEVDDFIATPGGAELLRRADEAEREKVWRYGAEQELFHARNRLNDALTEAERLRTALEDAVHVMDVLGYPGAALTQARDALAIGGSAGADDPQPASPDPEATR